MIENPVPWPNGARCAVAFTFDMDADSFLHLTHPRDSHRRIAVTSELRYGPTVGVPRSAPMMVTPEAVGKRSGPRSGFHRRSCILASKASYSP